MKLSHLYINALMKSYRGQSCIDKFGNPDLVMASYHGIPKEYFDKGRSVSLLLSQDNKTSVRETQFKDSNNIDTTFQSRFGPQEWLTTLH